MSDLIPEYKFCLNDNLDDSFLPTQGEPNATGWDVRSTIDLYLNPGDHFKIPLGFSVFSPKGWWLQLHPRSSSFVKRQMNNLIGIIDEDYSNEVMFAGQYLPNYANSDVLAIKCGDRIGQLIPVKRQVMKVTKVTKDEFDNLCKQRSSVRAGGFGSTDFLCKKVH